MKSRCLRLPFRHALFAPVEGADAPAQRSPRIVAAVVLAFVLLATGCGTASNRGAKTPPAASSPAVDPDPSRPGTAGVSQDVAASSPTPSPVPGSTLAIISELEPVIPPPEVAEKVLAAASDRAPESERSLQDCTDWIADPAISLEPVQTQECAAMLAAAVDTCRELDCFATPADTTAAPDPDPGPAPEGGHPPLPSAGMVPRDEPYWGYPTCGASPPWSSDCYPPSEWEVPQDLTDCFTPLPDAGVSGICASRRPDGPPHQELPRQTRDVIDWTNWCQASWHPLSCEFVLFQMKWSLDYLGAHPWCVLQQYYNRMAAHDDVWNRGAPLPADMRNHHGWHLCPSVIDPGQDADPRRRLSETGISVAEQCRIVLPANVQLEDRPRRVNIEPQRFGSDCDAWAEWVENRPIARDWRDCDRSARLAEEWMEHHHGTPEHYAVVTC